MVGGYCTGRCGDCTVTCTSTYTYASTDSTVSSISTGEWCTRVIGKVLLIPTQTYSTPTPVLPKKKKPQVFNKPENEKVPIFSLPAAPMKKRLSQIRQLHSY